MEQISNKYSNKTIIKQSTLPNVTKTINTNRLNKMNQLVSMNQHIFRIYKNLNMDFQFA